MKTRWKMLVITLIIGVPAFFLGPVIWTPSPDIRPTAAQLPYLLTLSAVEALFFGFGVAFIFYGFPLVRRIAPLEKKAALSMYVSLAWILVSWWPHDNLHIHNALDIHGLIIIDYSFHFTLIIAGAVLVYSFFALFKPAIEQERVKAREECPEDDLNCHPTPVHP